MSKTRISDEMRRKIKAARELAEKRRALKKRPKDKPLAMDTLQQELEQIFAEDSGPTKSYTQLLQEGHQPQGLLKILATAEMANQSPSPVRPAKDAPLSVRRRARALTKARR